MHAYETQNSTRHHNSNSEKLGAGSLFYAVLEKLLGTSSSYPTTRPNEYETLAI